MSKLTKGYGSTSIQQILTDLKTYLMGKFAEKANVSDIPVITGKADKVSNAIVGNFAGLDGSGNLVDSGKKTTDFADLIILAPEFNVTSDYGNGEYIAYNGSLYRFTSAHSAGAWNSAQVTEIKAVGQYVTAGKRSGTTLGDCATTEGWDTTASGDVSHAEGYITTASANNSHAEGNRTIASGGESHAEGYFTIASGSEGSHAEGNSTEASGASSHAGGFYTIAQRRSQTVIGEFNIADITGENISDRGKYIFIIGNGTADHKRSNAFAVDWDGNLEIAGNISASNIGTAASKSSTNAVTSDSTALVESGAVYTAINTAIGNAVDNLLATSY